MNQILIDASRAVRFRSDPYVVATGRSSRSGIDRLVQAIGWLSIGLGLTQLLAAPRYTRALGVTGKERVVRALGARELAHGMLTLSTERQAGLWSRVGGDALDMAVLGAAMRAGGRRGNLGLALALVVGVTALDLLSARGLSSRHGRRGTGSRDYRDRSGFPQGVRQARASVARLPATWE